MQYDVRTQVAVHDGLRVVVNPACESLRREELLEYGLTPVTLDLAAVLECRGKLIGAASRRVAVLHQAPYAFTHLPVALGLLLAVLGHSLAELGDVLAERVHYTPQALPARLGELFLPGFQHVTGIGLELRAHLRHSLVETLLQQRHRLVLLRREPPLILLLDGTQIVLRLMPHGSLRAAHGAPDEKQGHESAESKPRNKCQ